MTSTVAGAPGAVDRAEHTSPLHRVTSAPVFRIIVKRLLIAIPLLFVVSVLVFILLEAMPGDPAQNAAGMEASPEQVEALRQQMGLDRPAHERYFTWLFGFFTGNFGTSIVSGQTVSSMLAARLPVTLEIVFLSFVVSIGIAIPAALLAARKPGGVFDRVISFLAMTLLAVPNYVMALLLVLVFAVALRMLPAIGYVPFTTNPVGNLASVTLPVLALGLPLACFYARFLRGDLVEQVTRTDYIDTARAKGVGPWRALWMHAFRNSSFGLLTLVGLNVGTLIGGTVIIEQIFQMPGLGMMMLQGAMSLDVAVVQMCVFIFAATAVIANLVVDVLYAVLDPRIRYGNH